jgi:hypothetical protein
MDKVRMVCVPFGVLTGHFPNIFGKSSEKQIVPSSSISEYSSEVLLLGPTCFLLGF